MFVGGLPENSSEQLIMEVFGQCGDITAIRKSKKNFCHIRFAEEPTVDKALFLSGKMAKLINDSFHFIHYALTDITFYRHSVPHSNTPVKSELYTYFTLTLFCQLVLVFQGHFFDMKMQLCQNVS